MENIYQLTGERIVSPYEFKVIGNQEQIQNVLNFPQDGFIEDYKSNGYTIEMYLQNDIKIPAYNQELELKYIKQEGK